MTEPDDYERRFMQAGDAVAVSRARLGARWQLLFASVVLGSVVAAALAMLVPGQSRLAVLAAFNALAMAALWLTSMVVRVIVTRSEIRIQHGLFGPSIALDDVVELRAERHGFVRFLLGFGWGLGGKSLDGSFLYSTLGVPRGLVIRFRRGGKIATAFVSSDDPEALIAAVEQASAARFVRIAGEPERIATTDEEAEQVEDDAVTDHTKGRCDKLRA